MLNTTSLTPVQHQMLRTHIENLAKKSNEQFWDNYHQRLNHDNTKFETLHISLD